MLSYQDKIVHFAENSRKVSRRHCHDSTISVGVLGTALWGVSRDAKKHERTTEKRGEEQAVKLVISLFFLIFSPLPNFCGRFSLLPNLSFPP